MVNDINRKTFDIAFIIPRGFDYLHKKSIAPVNLNMNYFAT